MRTNSYQARLPVSGVRSLPLARHFTSRLRPALAALAGTAIVCAALPAFAHEAPKGWNYPFSCCSGYDCREVSAKQISERAEGYEINNTGEILPYSDARLKDSPDGEYHWCSVQGADDGKTICLFVPPSAY